MSEIKFCALGGLGENGKNLYMVTIDDKIFVLDAGLKYPSVELFGIDAVIPDISYLIENKNNVRGIFVSHGHDENCGAVVEVLRHINVPVFGSHFTISIIESALREAGTDISEYRLYRINDEKVLTYDNVSVSFFYTTHSLPESMGIIITTEDGAIVYAPDFSFSSTSDNHYQTSYGRISDLAKQKVLMLCTESLGVNNVDRVNNDYAFNHLINDELENSKRIIFSLFSYDLNRIQKVIDLCEKAGRKIAVLGRKGQRIIKVAMNTEYLKISAENLVNLRFIDETNDNNDDNLAVIITGIRHEPYYMLQRMIGGMDKLIKINAADTVVLIAPPVIGTEKIAARAKDQLSRIGCRIVEMKRNVLKSSHADGEDLRMMYQIVSPLYICPICGEYRHQYVQKRIAMDAGYREDRILVPENGDVIVFRDGELLPERDKIPVGDVLIDGLIVFDINEMVMKDRGALAETGIILVITNIDSTARRIVSGPKFVSRGFGTVAVQDEVKEEVIVRAEEIILNELKQKGLIDMTRLKTELREGIIVTVRSICRRNPIVIPVVIDVAGGEEL